MAPEIVSRIEYEGPPADIWASGILYYALLCGKFPFKGASDKELYEKINKGHFEIPDHVSTCATSFLLKIVNINPSQRLTAAQILADEYLCDDEVDASANYCTEASNTKSPQYNAEAYNEYYSNYSQNHLNQTAYILRPLHKNDHTEPNVTNLAGTINNNFNIIHHVTEINYCDDKCGSGKAHTYDECEKLRDSMKCKMPKKNLFVKSIHVT